MVQIINTSTSRRQRRSREETSEESLSAKLRAKLAPDLIIRALMEDLLKHAVHTL